MTGQAARILARVPQAAGRQEGAFRAGWRFL